MYNGKFTNAHHGRKRTGTLLASLLLLLTLTIGGTLAYLTTQTGPVKNTFTPAEVTCTVTDTVDENSVKKDIVVTNTGDIDAYLRVKLLTYRVNDQGQIIGGTATIPAFTLGEGWVKHTDGMYYYTRPVAPGKTPDVNLAASGIQMKDYVMRFNSTTGEKLSGDMDEGKQVIEVIAEAIQAEGVGENGTKAVVLAWGVDPETLGKEETT